MASANMTANASTKFEARELLSELQIRRCRDRLMMVLHPRLNRPVDSMLLNPTLWNAPCAI